ncbi:MAG: sigma 54-interacting transcriptional regulator [Planctomycetota bacterium]
MVQLAGGRAHPLGVSAPVQEILAQLPGIARSRVPVLIEGETGTGKLTLARMIHANSPRSAQPFGVLDCSSVPSALFTRELFGHARGAYTGADQSEPGRLRAANGGTFLLQGVEHLEQTCQRTLVRVLDDGEVLPVGETRPEAIDLRFVQTTETPLEEAVERGAIERELFYRWGALRLRIPPLRERREDLGFHLEYLLRREARVLRRETPRLSDELRRRLLEYDWPGNVSELEHSLQGLLTLCSRDRIGLGDLPRDLRQRLLGAQEPACDARVFSVPGSLSFAEQVAAFERTLLQRVWRERRGDRAAVLKELQLAPHQLKYLQKKYNLSLE